MCSECMNFTLVRYGTCLKWGDNGPGSSNGLFVMHKFRLVDESAWFTVLHLFWYLK